MRTRDETQSDLAAIHYARCADATEAAALTRLLNDAAATCHGLPSVLDAAPPGCVCAHGIGNHEGHGDGPYVCEVRGCRCGNPS